LVAVCLLLLGGCSWGGQAADAGVDAGVDAGPDGSDGSDGSVGSDASDASDDGGLDGGGEPEPTALPLGPEAVVALGAPGGLEVVAGALLEPDGGLLVVWERFDQAFSRGRLWSARSATGRDWTAPAELEFGAAALQASPSLVARAGGADLYLVRSAGIYAAAEPVAVPYADGAFGAVEPLAPVAGLDSLLSWPRFIAAGADGTALALRSGTGHPAVAFAADGRDFAPVQTVAARAVAMPALGRFAGGGYAYTFQTGSGGDMSAWFSLSADGSDWSEPQPVTSASSNVHDTALLNRGDGAIDLYYIYPRPPAGFCLHRRRLAADGSLGAEQQVTRPAVGEVSKPAALALPDGRRLLLWATITQRSQNGQPSEQIIHATTLYGDAP
jgi:hypothetical protein